MGTTITGQVSSFDWQGHVARREQLAKEAPEVWQSIQNDSKTRIEEYIDAYTKASTMEEKNRICELMNKEKEIVAQAVIDASKEASTSAETATTPSAVGANAEANAEAKAEVKTEAPQKPAEEKLQFGEHIQNQERVLIRKEFTMAEADLAASEAELKKMQADKSIPQEAIFAQELKIEELKSAISGTKKLAAGEEADEVEKESVKNVFGRNVIMKGTKVEDAANEISLKAILEPNFNAEDLYNKDLTLKTVEKPAGAQAVNKANTTISHISKDWETAMNNYDVNKSIEALKTAFKKETEEARKEILENLQKDSNKDLYNALKDVTK